jgi:hypothetical protein
MQKKYIAAVLACTFTSGFSAELGCSSMKINTVPQLADYGSRLVPAPQFATAFESGFYFADGGQSTRGPQLQVADGGQSTRGPQLQVADGGQSTRGPQLQVADGGQSTRGPQVADGGQGPRGPQFV